MLSCVFAAKNTRHSYSSQGSGKTSIVRALVQENQYKVVQVKCKTIVRKFYGEGPKALSAIFRLAAQEDKSIIFLDELDAIMTHRDKSDSASNRLSTTLMTELSGLSKCGTIFIGATNFPDKVRTLGFVLLVLFTTGENHDVRNKAKCSYLKIDVAIRDRISHHIYLPLPSGEARKKYLEKELCQLKVMNQSELDVLVNETEDFNFRDMQKLVQLCVETSIENAKRANHFVKIPGQILTRKYRACFCQDTNHGIRMKFNEKKGQIDLFLSFQEIKILFESFNRNPQTQMVADLEHYNEENGIADIYHDLQIEIDQQGNALSLCYRLNPRKLMVVVLIISVIVLGCWFYFS